MDPKAKSKPGRPKSKINNTENKEPENSSLERVVQDDKDSSIENGLFLRMFKRQGISRKLPKYENLSSELQRVTSVIEDEETGLSASLRYVAEQSESNNDELFIVRSENTVT